MHYEDLLKTKFDYRLKDGRAIHFEAFQLFEYKDELYALYFANTESVLEGTCQLSTHFVRHCKEMYDGQYNIEDVDNSFYQEVASYYDKNVFPDLKLFYIKNNDNLVEYKLIVELNIDNHRVGVFMPSYRSVLCKYASIDRMTFMPVKKEGNHTVLDSSFTLTSEMDQKALKISKDYIRYQLKKESLNVGDAVIEFDVRIVFNDKSHHYLFLVPSLDSLKAKLCSIDRVMIIPINVNEKGYEIDTKYMASKEFVQNYRMILINGLRLANLRYIKSNNQTIELEFVKQIPYQDGNCMVYMPSSKMFKLFLGLKDVPYFLYKDNMVEDDSLKDVFFDKKFSNENTDITYGDGSVSEIIDAFELDNRQYVVYAPTVESIKKGTPIQNYHFYRLVQDDDFGYTYIPPRSEEEANRVKNEYDRNFKKTLKRMILNRQDGTLVEMDLMDEFEINKQVIGVFGLSDKSIEANLGTEDEIYFYGLVHHEDGTNNIFSLFGNKQAYDVVSKYYKNLKKN